MHRKKKFCIWELFDQRRGLWSNEKAEPNPVASCYYWTRFFLTWVISILLKFWSWFHHQDGSFWQECARRTAYWERIWTYITNAIGRLSTWPGIIALCELWLLGWQKTLLNGNLPRARTQRTPGETLNTRNMFLFWKWLTESIKWCSAVFPTGYVAFI